MWHCMQVRGKRTFFAGTNIFYILLRQSVEDPLGFTDEAVVAYFAAQVMCLHVSSLAPMDMPIGSTVNPHRGHG